MRIDLRTKDAFSLTELIIVLVIIALLFAVMSPIITKRHIADTGTFDTIWNYVNNDSEWNSYFDPGAPDWTSSVYVGMDPVANYKNSGKLVINSGTMTYDGVTYLQPQLQFRFSPNENELNNGIDAGSILVGTNDNLYFGQIHNFGHAKNTIMGTSNLVDVTDAQNQTIVGFRALEHISQESNLNADVTVIGANAANNVVNTMTSGDDISTLTGIYLGSGAGVKTTYGNGIGIGYHAYFEETSGAINNNIAIGANTGSHPSGAEISSNNISNIAIGSKFFTSANSEYNTIIGYGSYELGAPELTNDAQTDHVTRLTAIGYRACNSITHDNGINTCIGYKSGSSVPSVSPSYATDGENIYDEHILLGGTPLGGFGGRAVMEVHNYNSGNNTYGSNADVVFNSNLVIRGKLYTADYTSSSSVGAPVNYDFIDSYDSSWSGHERKHYRCTSDSFGALLLVYNVFVCTDEFNLDASGDGVSLAPARTINMLKRSGTVSNTVMQSDEQLKINIVENNDGLDKILKLQPYNYTFKTDIFGKSQVGVIAQDLEKIFPTSVSKDEKGYLKIRWDEMFYAMINSIKQLSQKVEQLTKKLALMVSDIDTIKKEHKDLRIEVSSLDKRIKALERK